MRRRHDGLCGHRQDVGVPSVAKNPAGGVVEDEVVADVDPGDRRSAFGEPSRHLQQVLQVVKFETKFLSENDSKFKSTVSFP